MAVTEPISRRRWIVVALVFVAIMLNYVDRQILALLKPTLQAEFSWTDGDYADMQSAFQVAAAFAFLGTGWFIDKVGLRIGFGLGVGAWSLAAMAHAFASTVTGFITARAVLGAAESVGTPAAVKAAATYFGPEDRSLALGIGNVAPNVGAVLTPLIIPAVAIAYGWQAAFLLAGGLGLVWVLVWFAARLPAPAVQADAAPAVPWRSLFRDRRIWALLLAKVLSDQVWFFMLSWLPDLFNRMFGLQQGQIGLPVALVFALAATGAIAGGLLPTRLLARGWSVNRARKVSMLLFALLVVPVPLVLLVDSAWTAALLLGLGLFAHQGFSTNVFAFATDVYPARSVGSAIGIAAFAGNLWSIGLIQFAAWSLANGFGYTPSMFICALSYLAALGLLHLIVPRIEAVGGGAAA